MIRIGCISAVLVLLCESSLIAGEQQTPILFETHIRPVLKTHCFDCHGEGDKLRGGLDLRLRRLIEKGGESGSALAAAKSRQSLLLEKIRKGDMPPTKKKLTQAEVALIENWIKTGAKAGKPEPETLPAGMQISEEDRAYWAFQPVRRPKVPDTDSSTPRQNPH